MAQGNRAAVQVNLLFHYAQQFQVFQNRQRLASEGFVQFPEVDVFNFQACTLQCLLGGRNRTITHDCGITTSDCHAADLGDRSQAQCFCTLGGHQHHGRRAVSQLGRRTGSYRAVLRIKRRPQLAKGLNRGFRTNGLVFFNQLHKAVLVVAFNRNDFVLEAAFEGGFVGQAMGTGTELILLLTGDTVHLGQHFRGQAHHVGRFCGVLGGSRVVVKAGGHGHVAHVLYATNHEHIAVTGHDGLGRSVDGAHGRTTQTVNGLGCRLVRDTGQQGNLPGHVKALLVGLVHTAPDYVFYFFRVELRVALKQCFNKRSGQSLGAYVAETAVFGTTHRSPHAIDDDNVSRIKAHRSFSVRKSRSGLTKELFASLGHFMQLIGRMVQRTKICILVCQFNELVDTHVVDITQGASTERREADTEDQTHIGISRVFNNAIFQAANGFKAQWDHHASNDVFIAELVLTLNNRLKQLVGLFIDNLLLLALAVQLVLVETNIVLLTVTVVFKHYVDCSGFCVLHTIREAVSHYFTSMLAGIHANNVQQVCRAHRPAELFHNLVDFLEVGTVTYQANKTAKVREQNAVNQEARAIVYNDRSLTHGLGVSHSSRNSAITGLLATDNLNQRHHVHRVEEVHATEVFRALQVLGQKVYGNGRGVRRQNRVFTNRIFYFTQNRIFYFRVFNNGLNNQVYVFEITVVQRWSNTVENICHLACFHAAFVDTLGEQLFGFIQTQGNTILVNVLHDDRRAFQC